MSSKLHQAELWTLGLRRHVEQRRSLIERQIDLLKQEARNEQRQCWQDIAQLKAERRQWLKQYRDALLRANVVLGRNR